MDQQPLALSAALCGLTRWNGPVGLDWLTRCVAGTQTNVGACHPRWATLVCTMNGGAAEPYQQRRHVSQLDAGILARTYLVCSLMRNTLDDPTIYATGAVAVFTT